MELKQGKSISEYVSDYSSNRTVMELKHTMFDMLQDGIDSSNRTVMELKQTDNQHTDIYNTGSNRTVMELKREQQIGFLLKSNVLIAP